MPSSGRPPHLHSFLHDALPIYRCARINGSSPSSRLRMTGKSEPEAHLRRIAGHFRLRHLDRDLRQEHRKAHAGGIAIDVRSVAERSEEHTSELQSPYDLVCRLLAALHIYTLSYTTLFRSTAAHESTGLRRLRGSG